MSYDYPTSLKDKIIRFFRRIIFFSVIPFFSTFTYAQNYFFDNYGIAEGLAQSTVFDILQDQNHYVWLGTRAGVSRFDGLEFRNYSIENGLAPNGVKIIFQDKNKLIWFGHSGGGVSILEEGKFRIFTAPGEIFSSDITSISADSSGRLWISTELSGIVMITEEGNTLKGSTYEHFIGNKLSDRIFGATTLKNGNVIFITDAFLKTYSPDSGGFRNYEIGGMPIFFQITCLYEDSRDHLWFGTHNGGLYQYIPAQDTFVFYDSHRNGIGSNWISTISEDSRGNTLIGTWGGGFTRIGKDGIKTFNLSNGLSDSKIRKIISDAEGNILIGTEEHGLAIFKGEQFVSFFEKDGLANPQVWSILQDRRGEYWLGTNEGISIYNPEMEAGSQFRLFNKLQENRIRFIKEDSRGRIWIATDNEGVFTYIPDEKLFTFEGRLNSYISTLATTALETDDKAGLWVGTLDGLIYYTYDDGIAQYYTQSSGIAGNEITSLYFDHQKRLWIGSRATGITVYSNNEFKIIGLEENYTPTVMIMDNKGLLWVGTESHGVIVFDPVKNEIVKSITEENGLLSNLINAVQADNFNNIYIGSNNGLSIYYPDVDKVFAYTRKNGFMGIETKRNASFKDRKGLMWFGTVNGITRFNPEISRAKNEEPLTHILGLQVNHKDRKMVDGMKLKSRENTVIFDYVSICLTNPDAVNYKIFLEGADNDWRFDQPPVTYTTLPPKKYTFHLIAQNSDGNWNQEPIRFSFQIMPPFYQTWWFILICILSGIISIIAYITIREQQLKRENRILEEKVRARTAEVVIQKEELAEKNKDITDSIRYAKRIQFAILPPEIPFKDTFILFKPKDIVSGDFYWLDVHRNREFLAAVDCTGHGVPGAFMSIIGNNILNKIIREQHIYKPSEILNSMNRELIHVLQRHDETGGAVQDGMDISMTCYHKDTMELEFSGALNPLYLVRNGDIQEIRADRFSIGRSTNEEKKQFTNHVIKILPGDVIYLFSDGYADQFGGEAGKKFKTKPMQELILAIADQSMEVQKVILDNTIEAWRGDINQVDDILIIGRRF